MRKYGDLNLKEIRDKCDLDFAHFTYQRGMCTCCYGPKDLPTLYWKDRIIPVGNDFEYILFKNADNDDGAVSKFDEIKHYTCIEWRFNQNKMQTICEMLLNQLDDDYYLLVPESDRFCIIICRRDSVCNEKDNYNPMYRINAKEDIAYE